MTPTATETIISQGRLRFCVNFTPGIGNPPDAGWTLIARVNSDEYFGLAGIARPAQQASSITSARGAVGEYRHLLFVVQPTPGMNHDGRELNFTTFFGEIDVHAE
jgi:hypothetical protein